MTNARAVRYRRLALAEPDPKNADVLQRLADEAERGVLCVADKLVETTRAASLVDPIVIAGR
jgi:hypothetical protein